MAGRRFPWRCRAVVVWAIAAAVLLVPTPASAAGSGGIGIRLLDTPVDRADDPRAQVYIVDHLSPGTVIDRRVEVSNTTAEPVTVGLSKGGAEIVEGQFRPATTATRASEWTTVTPASVTLAPGERAEVLVRIDVPRDAPDGEFYGAIWATPPASTAGATRIVNRVGVRMYLSVGTSSEPTSDFRITAIGAEKRPDESRAFLARVVNTGGRAIDVGGQALLGNGPGGTSAGPLKGRDVTLLPDEVGELRFEAPPELPDGPWDVRVVLRAGSLEREATARLTIPSESGTVWVQLDADGSEGDRTATTDAGAAPPPATGGDQPEGAERTRGSSRPVPVPAIGAAVALIVGVSAAAATVARRGRPVRT